MSVTLPCRSSKPCGRDMVWSKESGEWRGVCPCGYSTRTATSESFALDTLAEASVCRAMSAPTSGGCTRGPALRQMDQCNHDVCDRHEVAP